MSDQSTNLALPFVAAAQAQKHVTINQSLLRLDALVQLSVVSASIAVQPGAAADGALYLLPAGKTGADWGGMSNGALAYYRDGAWEQISPREGFAAYVKDADIVLAFNGSSWSQIAPGYEEGAWTPTLTFSTPGDLAVSYVTQIGEYARVGKLVFAAFEVRTSSFTHATASGDLRIGGLPFPMRTGAVARHGAAMWGGITKAGYTDLTLAAVSGVSYLALVGSGSGVAVSAASAADAPSGGAVRVRGMISYPLD